MSLSITDTLQDEPAQRLVTEGVLHLVTRVASKERLIDYVNNYLTDTHALVLLEEAVYAIGELFSDEFIEQTQLFTGNLLLLEDDLLARGLSWPCSVNQILARPQSRISLINYCGLVDLVVKYKAVRSLSLD